MKVVLTMAFLGIAWVSFGQYEREFDDTSREEILECIQWLQSTPIHDTHELRKDANAYLLQWVSRSPFVQVELHTDIVDLAERNPDLLAIYISGWAAYALSIKSDYPSVDAHIKGMEAVVKFYKDNKEGLHRDKFIEKLIKKEQKGKMYKTLRKQWG